MGRERGFHDHARPPALTSSDSGSGDRPRDNARCGPFVGYPDAYGIRALNSSRPSDLRALGERASIRWFYGLRGLVPHRGSLSCRSVNTTTCSMVVGRGPPDVVIWSWYRIPDSL